MENLSNSPCKRVFEYFKEMNTIPRGSGNEKAVSDWLVAFAKNLGLEVIQDKALNVIIRKDGTEGFENSERVILQGHMDMVCEKEEEKDHDFTKDPIEFIVEDGFIHADRTTLGADNGIAVCYALDLLASTDIPHPPIEALFTTSEETGMDGAFALNPKDLKSKRLINIDSEVEGEILVSCAGGMGTITKLDIAWEDACSCLVAKKISIEGLIGGHSGMEIDKQRGNAIVLLGRFLNGLKDQVDYSLASIDGPGKHNAIPRKASATILIKEENLEKLNENIKTWESIFKNELRKIDEGLRFKVEDLNEKISKSFSNETRDKALKILILTPIGVQNVSFDIEGLVQTSNNLGVVTTKENQIEFLSAMRSSVNSLKYEIYEKLKTIAELTGAKIEKISEYPEWQYKEDSILRPIFVETYKEMYGEDVKISAVHAGLECGLFSEKFNGSLDQISFGPNLYDVHTPKEKMDIASVERCYELLKRVLVKLK